MRKPIISLLLLAAANRCLVGSTNEPGAYIRRYQGVFSRGERSLLASGDANAAWPEEPLDSKGCPKWVNDYVEWHRENRGKPDAKYLVGFCARKHAGKCPGLGDRFRGMEYATKLAMITKRVILFWWDTPAPLETFVEPSDMNWLVTPDLDIDMPKQLNKLWSWQLDRGTGKFPDEYYSERVVTITTNHFDEGNELPGPRFTLVSKASSCLFNALWKPTAAVVERTQEVRQQLLGKGVGDGQYTAIHLRMGHLAGEMYDVNRGWERYKGLLGVVRCAQHYALGGVHDPAMTSISSSGSGDGKDHARALQRTKTRVKEPEKEEEEEEKKSGSSSSSTGKGSLGARSSFSNDNWDFKPPVLLLTDDVVLRTMVADGLFRGFVGPAYVAHHLQRTSDSASVDEHIATFVDLLMLARSKCLIHSASGFSKTAMVWGWPSCETDVKQCMAKHYLHVTGEVPAGR
uniref:O-fucosyltransferase family protein n=1 Tax=Chlamydomonas leiostraca TaxID=1034604 RepID=A0A7S0WQ61_9CHLO